MQFKCKKQTKNPKKTKTKKQTKQNKTKTVSLQTIQFSIKTFLFQTIQFGISTQFSSTWPLDRTLSGATTPDQSGPGSNGNEGVLCIRQTLALLEPHH